MSKVFIFLLLSIFVFSCTDIKTKVQPNIILIMSDDQGWGDLSCKGNTNLSTPNIDKLAETGITFDRFFVSPVCSPTRAELLTGRYHVRGGVYATSRGGERLDLDEETIAEVFKRAGYNTAAYGKWHNGMQPPYHPNSRGFNDYYGFCSGHWGNYFSPMLEHNGAIIKGNGYLTDDFTDHGLAFIEENKDKPFFLYLPFNTPHSPNQVPDRWWNKFENKDLQLLNRTPESENILETKAALAMCENIDWNVGRITQKVEELGLLENTIIIYLSDNGPNTWRWNDGMKGKKGSTDEGGVRSPLIVKWEGTFKPGKKITQIAAAIDLLPTLCDLAQIEYSSKNKIDGISLKPLLLEEKPEWDERFIINHWRKTSIRSQQYRMDYDGKLFDMNKDPGQLKDIATEKPEVAKKLSSALENWKNEVLSELPANDERPFTIGDPDFSFSQIPARDGTESGAITRSDNSPNCTFFTNWVNENDSIFWPAEVLKSGKYEVELYYTCPAKDVGSSIQLSFGDSNLITKILEPHDPPLKGMENDRVLRTQSYVKDFKRISMGIIQLEKGKGNLSLKATDIPGSQAMDFRLLMFKRVL
ncbi:arylsulfatase [Draconibacterium sp.]|nr:arylsulfatase [Draconibacterium sp.]